MKPALSPTTTGCLPRLSASASDVLDDGVVGHDGADDLDELEHRCRVEEVHAHDLGRAARRDRDVGDRQGRGVRGEDRVGSADAVELREDRPLEVQPLRDRLDDEVGGRRGRSRALVNRIRPMISSRSPSVSLPRARARPVEWSTCSRPRSTASSLASTPTTSYPLRANTSAIPAPIVPRPTTPTLLIVPLPCADMTLPRTSSTGGAHMGATGTTRSGPYACPFEVSQTRPLRAPIPRPIACPSWSFASSQSRSRARRTSSC